MSHSFEPEAPARKPSSLEPQSSARPRGRILGIDPGKARLGFAVTDSDRRIASPLANYQRRDLAQDAAYLRKIVAEEAVVQIVVGLPVHLSGREGEQAVAARKFGAWVAESTGLPIVFWDERFTTSEAEASLLAAGLTSAKRKSRRDQVAATLLLQSYVDAGCPEESAPPTALDA